MRSLMFTVIAVAACGGGATQGPTTPAGPTTSTSQTPALEPQVGELQWYRAVSTCGQGPFEVEVPATGNKWGEEIELRIATPRKIALHAVMVVDGAELAKTDTVIDRDGRTSGAPDNSKCIADVRERLVLGRAGTGTGTPGTPIVPGRRVPDAPETPAVQLERTREPDYMVPSTLIHVRLEKTIPAGARIRIRFWSVEPNDLTGVLFGAVRIAWRPNVSEADYEAYLVRVAQEQERYAQEQEAKRLRYEEEERLRAERSRRQLEEARKNYRPPPVDLEAEARAARENERRAREQAERDRRDRLNAEEAARRRAVEAALEADRARRRAEWCDAHRDSRDCWGAGGYRVHAELITRGEEREQYCRANKADARCWTDAERYERKAAWKLRVTNALQPPKQPEGPPPSPLADPQPPKLSENATWRPGYWSWLDGNWMWLAGQWNVPERDIEEEKTTRAPSAPPPPPVETVVIAPARTAVWIPGFWQWNGTQWIWFPGSWQVRPSGLHWRATQWRARGSVHILVPGGWIR